MEGRPDSGNAAIGCGDQVSPLDESDLFGQIESEIIHEDKMKSVIWEEEIALRPNLPLKIRRVKNYTREGGAKDRWTTELECLGKTLGIAPVQVRSNAAFLLNGWVKVLDPILSKYELEPCPTRPKSVDSPESFMQAVTQTEKYKLNYQE